MRISDWSSVVFSSDLSAGTLSAKRAGGCISRSLEQFGDQQPAPTPRGVGGGISAADDAVRAGLSRRAGYSSADYPARPKHRRRGRTRDLINSRRLSSNRRAGKSTPGQGRADRTNGVKGKRG